MPSVGFKRGGRASASASGLAARARRGAPSVALAVVLLLLMGSAWQPHASASAQAQRPAGALPLAPRPVSLGAGPVGAAPAQNPAGSPSYDEQMGATFFQNFTTLAYNVTVLAQADADGYGPAYILNGLTAQDYFYQVSVSYNWPDDPAPFPGFGFSYDVFGPFNAPAFPVSGGSGLDNFTGTVNSGDKVLLSLSFNATDVVMSARDWDTGATAQTGFSNEGSSSFIGSPTSHINFQGYFTGLMTEWYHFSPYSGNERGVTYTSDNVALTSAWMWVDEFDASPASLPIFTNDTRTTFANDRQVYPFYADGASMFISAHQFTTGLPTAAIPSAVTLTPVANEPHAPSFSAAYTLSGSQQTATILTGTTVLGADPGTLITISVDSSPSPGDKWVFGGTSVTQVTVAAGENATYVLYHLVKEIVSYQVAAGGGPFPASAALEFRYSVPSPVPSATAGQVSATQAVSQVPVVIYALIGTHANVDGTIPGAAGERWVTTAQDWNVTAGGLVPYPIEFYQQYEVTIGYTVAGGGGAPSQAPEFTAAVFGVLTSTPLSGQPTTAWFDAGSAYYFSGVVGSPGGSERWLGSGTSGSPPPLVSTPGESISEVYSPQYYVSLGVNDARGGSVYNDSGWFDPGASLIAKATANQGWQLGRWSSSGAGGYNGTSPSVSLVVAGPLREEAVFYVQLTIRADTGTDVGYSYPTQSGTVKAGSTLTLYVPPSNVSLRAAPSFFLYSFGSWQGQGVSDAKAPSTVLAVDSPSAVASKSSYNYAGVLVLAAGAAALAVNAAVGSLAVRGRRRRARLSAYGRDPRPPADGPLHGLRLTSPGISAVVLATAAPAFASAVVFDSAVP